MLTAQNNSFSDEDKRKVWNKGEIVPDYNKDLYRKDIAGAWIAWVSYGDTSNELGLGWEIDHVKPESINGTDDINNLRPLQWKNNRTKSDDYPIWVSDITSDGKKNIKKRGYHSEL